MTAYPPCARQTDGVTKVSGFETYFNISEYYILGAGNKTKSLYNSSYCRAEAVVI